MKQYYRVDASNSSLTSGPYTKEEYIKLFTDKDFKDHAEHKRTWKAFIHSEMIRLGLLDK